MNSLQLTGRIEKIKFHYNLIGDNVELPKILATINFLAHK